MPLRTKQGKEVLPQVQGVINRLEAAGFPVHRYHSDRAKELRSAALINWLKNQAIHPTWTAGESPAGNRAELADSVFERFYAQAFGGLWVAEALLAAGSSARFYQELD